MDIEQDAIPCFRLFCPTRFRPFAAYGINSNIFEFVRFEKNFSKLGQTEILVYETEFKYNQNSLKSIPERLIGKVVYKHSFDAQISQIINIVKYDQENKSF